MKLTIDKLGMNGEGVARGEKVTFVPYALPNETVEAEIVEEKSKFCNAKLSKVIVESNDRKTPPCPYFMECGGCNLQHLKYEKQAEFKQNLVKETLHKVGGIDEQVLPCVTANSFSYRNKGVFPISKNIGMFRFNSHQIIPIQKCLLMNEKINEALDLVRNWLEKYNISTFDFNTFKGLVKYLVVRSVNNQTLVCLVSTSKNIPHLAELQQQLSNLGDYGLYLNINTQKNSIILGNDYIHICGLKSIELEEFGVKYNIDVASFLQVNNEIKNKLYSEVIDYMKDDVVIDAYAGAGLLSAILSKSANQVYSVEIVPQASQKAKELVKQNDITNMQVINGDCGQILPKITNKLTNFSVVLDPAHIGCDKKVLEAVKNANKIVYIACNPIALSKDLKTLLITHKIVKIQPFDMFPQTKHIETLAVLQHK